MSAKNISILVILFIVAALAWPAYQYFSRKRVTSIVAAPVVQSDKQKVYAQSYDEKANALFESMNKRIEDLERQSNEAKQKGLPQVSAEKQAEAKKLQEAADDYREKVDKYAKGKPAAPPAGDKNNDQNQGAPAPPPSSASVPQPPPVPQLSDSGADDQQMQAAMDLAAVGACVIEPEVCPFAQALAGLFGSMNGETRRSVIKLFAGAALGGLNQQDMQTLLDAAAKDPNFRSALSGFLENSAHDNNGIADQVKQLQDFVDHQVQISDTVRQLKALIVGQSSCDDLKSHLPGNKFASLDQKALVGALALNLGSSGATAWKCLQDVEVQ